MLLCTDRDIYGALRCKLDGVTQQVGDDLSDAQPITHIVGEHTRGGGDAELQVFFLGQRAKHRLQRLQQVCKTEVHRIENHFIGFRLGEIQHIID